MQSCDEPNRKIFFLYSFLLYHLPRTSQKLLIIVFCIDPLRCPSDQSENQEFSYVNSVQMIQKGKNKH